jgi:uncharacterized membrane protein
MTTPALASESVSPWVGLFGSFHPGVVHFPIGLLAAAAILELWQILRKKPGLSPATPALLALAALTAPPASLFGFLLADSEKTEGATLNLHKWLGLAASVLAVLAACVVLKARTSPGALKICRLLVFAGTGSVLATGYLGGEMVFGEGHILNPLKKIFGYGKSPTPPKDGKLPLPTMSKTISNNIDFETQVAPIIKESCIKCHNPGKKKGKLLLDTKANAMKGGENGAILIPGKPGESSFYKLLIDPDDDVRMPEKAKPLPKDQIETIRKWIEQGADWPESFTIK